MGNRYRGSLHVEQLETRWCPSVVGPEPPAVPEPEPAPELAGAFAPEGTLRQQIQWAKAVIHWKDYAYWGVQVEELALTDPGAAEELLLETQRLTAEFHALIDPSLTQQPLGLLAEGEEAAPPTDAVIVQRARDFLAANRVEVRKAKEAAVAAAEQVDRLTNEGAPKDKILAAVVQSYWATAVQGRAAQDQAELRAALTGENDFTRARNLENLLFIKDAEAADMKLQATQRLRRLERMPNTTPPEKRAFEEASLHDAILSGRALDAQRFMRDLRAVVTNP